MKGKIKYEKPDSADFLRYMKGEMTEGERNSFERELQRNPFAQEAMDGMETIPAGEVQRDLGSLRKRLSRRSSPRSRFKYYRIAASVAVLMIISSVFYVVERSKVSEQPSIPEYRQVPMEIEKTEPVRKAEPDEQPEAKPSPPAASLQQDVSSGTERDEKSSDIVREELNEPEKIEPMQELQLPVQRKSLYQMPAIVEKAVTDQPAAAARSRMKTDSGISLAAFAGKAKPVEITISGFEESLNEKRITDTAGVYSPPQPVNGKDEYERYILEHITRPDSAAAGQRVVVVAAFNVLTDGSLDSIRIVRSPEKKFSDEVLRLISTGPSWKPATRNGAPVEDEVRLSVVFR